MISFRCQHPPALTSGRRSSSNTTSKHDDGTPAGACSVVENLLVQNFGQGFYQSKQSI